MAKAQETLVLTQQAYEFLKRRYPDKLKCTSAKCRHKRIKAGQTIHRRRTTGGITRYYHIECWEELEGF